MNTSQEKRPKLEIHRTQGQLDAKKQAESLMMARKTREKVILEKMKQNQDKIKERGEKLSDVVEKTKKMSHNSFRFLDNCRKLNGKMSNSSTVIGISSNGNQEEKDEGTPIIIPKEEKENLNLKFQSEITPKSTRVEGDTEIRESVKCPFSHYENDIFDSEKKLSNIKEIDNNRSDKEEIMKKKNGSWIAWCC